MSLNEDGLGSNVVGKTHQKNQIVRLSRGWQEQTTGLGERRVMRENAVTKTR